MASKDVHGGGSDGHNGALGLHSVLERVTVMRPLPSSQRWTSPHVNTAAAERQSSAPDNTATRATSNLSLFLGLLGCFVAAAAATGLVGGEPDHSKDVGGEGAGLPLGRVYARVSSGLFLIRPLMGLADGWHGEAQRGDAGAGASAGGQVPGQGERFRKEGLELHLVAPIGEQPPLSAVAPAGVIGENRLQRGGHALVGGPQHRR